MPASEPALPSRAPAYLIAGLIHAAAMLLAFPPLDLWGFAFVAPMPLAWAGWARGGDLIRFGRRAKLGHAVVLVTLGAVPLHAYAHQWVIDVSALGYPFFVLIMSAMAGVFVWMLSVVHARWPRIPLAVAAPVIWIALEVFRGEILGGGYPWLLIAHPTIGAHEFATTAGLLGTYFTGFLVVGVASAALDLLIVRSARVASIGVLIGVAIAVFAGMVLAPVPRGRPVRLALVQTNVPQSNKLEWEFGNRLKDFAAFAALTRSGAAKADLIIWPETMFPGMTLSETGIQEERAAGLTFTVPREVDERRVVPSLEFYDRLLALSNEVKRPMLVGALGFDGLSIGPDPKGGVNIDFKARYNSVFMVDQGRVDPRAYSKIELTPFGEEMPGFRHWPWLQRQVMALGAGGMSFDLSRGPGPRAFSLSTDEPCSVVTPVCFEATKPGLCRRLVRAAGPGPVLMANLTNDGWFGGFRAGRLQHLQLARWRCIELGVPMVRAANTGISAVIDASGRVTAWGVDGQPGAWNTEGVLTATVTATPASTLYARIGDDFGWLVLVLGVFGVLLGLVQGASRKEGFA